MARAGIGMDEQRTGRCASYRSPRYIWPREWHGDVDTDTGTALWACTCYQDHRGTNTFGFDAESRWARIVVRGGRWITSKSDDVICECNDYEWVRRVVAFFRSDTFEGTRFPSDPIETVSHSCRRSSTLRHPASKRAIIHSMMMPTSLFSGSSFRTSDRRSSIERL